MFYNKDYRAGFGHEYPEARVRKKLLHEKQDIC
jgi:hypothetical protein